MKFKQYLRLLVLHSPDGSFPTSHLRWEIQQNQRRTAREEAIAASIVEQANPRENITGHFPWGPEQRMVLQQLWFGPNGDQWRDVPIKGSAGFYTEVSTEHGDLPVPNALKEPGAVRGNLRQRLDEVFGGD